MSELLRDESISHAHLKPFRHPRRRCWDGLASGYEGTFMLGFGALSGSAVEPKLITPTTPEWWPAEAGAFKAGRVR